MNKILLFILLLIPAMLQAQEKDLSDLSIPELSKLLPSEFQALKSNEQKGDKTGQGKSLGNIGDIYLNIGKQLADKQEKDNSAQVAKDKKANLDKAIEYYNRSIPVSEEVGDVEQLKRAYKNLSAAQKLSGSLKEAVASYAKYTSLKKSKNSNELEKKQIEYVHGKKEDSIRKKEQIAEESLKEKERILTLKQRQLDSANRAISEADKTITQTQQEKKSVSLALQKTQTDLSLEKQTTVEKEKQISLAEQEKALQATNLQLQESKLELQKSKLELQQNELQIKDKVLGHQRTYIYFGLAGIFILVVFSFFIIREQRKTLKQKQRAERSEKFKEQFIANISHEIRTPMNSINGMTGLLLQKNPRPEQEAYLKAISKSSDILLHVINDVLDLSKIEAGKLELETIDFSLSDTVQQVKDTLSYRAEDKGLQLVTRIDDKLDDVLVGDPYRLNQILINIGGNALKFTEKGGVHIDLDLVNKENGNVSIRFSISDTGIGIPADKIPTLFENFTQVSSSDTRKFGGTGLGLSISRRLVELQGGKIEVESTLGSGTTFSFVIKYPLGSAKRLQQRISSEQNVNGSILNGLRILIADDNEYNRMVVDETLHLMADVYTDLVVNGQEAVDMMEKNDYDLILMDVQMPVMNGMDATKYIRSHLPAPKNKVPIIALTASVLRADIDLCFQAGMTAYVPKPFKPWQLINTIADVTGRERTAENSQAPVNNKKEQKEQKEQHNNPTNNAEEFSVYEQNGKVTNLDYLRKFCEGDEKRMNKYIKIYINALPAFSRNIEAAVATKDFVEIALHVHSFKPKWMMMGMKQTNELGIKIDQLCKAQSDKVFENLKVLIEEMNKSVQELEGNS